MVLIIAITWFAVSALTILFIMGAHAAKQPGSPVKPAERQEAGSHSPAGRAS